jgi:hypothetical protein
LLFLKFSNAYFKNKKNQIRQNQGIGCKCAFAAYYSSFKKGGKIQTGLNCEYDGLSETSLSFSHSRGNEGVYWKHLV